VKILSGGMVLLMAALLLVSVPMALADEQQLCGKSDVVLVIDRSGSMGGTPLADAKDAAKGFVDLLNLGDDKAASASFASSASLEQGLTTDGTAVKNAIDSLTASGSTCIACGLYIAQGELDANGRGDSSHVIILLSDGEPNIGDAMAAADAAKAAGTIIFTIGIGGADVDLMEDLASDPSFFSYGDSGDLADIYAEIADEVCGLPEPGNGVPEFGVLAAVGILGVVGAYIFRRRS
jgi:uncharacterized protein YegL